MLKNGVDHDCNLVKGNKNEDGSVHDDKMIKILLGEDWVFINGINAQDNNNNDDDDHDDNGNDMIGENINFLK